MHCVQESSVFLADERSVYFNRPATIVQWHRDISVNQASTRDEEDTVGDKG